MKSRTHVPLRKTARFFSPWICSGWVFLTAMMLSYCSGADDSGRAEDSGFFSHIYQEKPVPAYLAFNLDSVIQHKEEEVEVDGRLTLELPEPLSVPVEIRARGVTRKDYCSFPPLRIQLKKEVPGVRGWGDFRSYKLVTHCSDSLRDQELLLREYLVYKLYEKLTDISMRTQLLEMQYFIPGDTLQRFAFFIENEDEMNARLGLEPLDPETSAINRIHLEHYKRFVLFQYMIGNTDWNLSSGHNTQYVVSPGSETPIVVPYDFDYCGLVNASYARPYPSLPIKNVRERYIMYRGKKDDDFSAIIDEFLSLKTVWLEAVQQFPYLSDAPKQDMSAYLEEFFVIIGNPDWKEKVFQ